MGPQHYLEQSGLAPAEGVERRLPIGQRHDPAYQWLHL
jgi:hypothetical protein